MPWFQSRPELEKKLQMKYTFDIQYKKVMWVKNNSKEAYFV